jgi:hypothetical protein
MSGLEARATALGAARAERVAARLAAAIAVPGVRAEVSGAQVILRGRGLGRRLVAEPGIGWWAGWLR